MNEEQEEKIGTLTLQHIEKFINTLSPSEQEAVFKIDNQLFGKIWQASFLAAIEIIELDNVR